MFETCVEGREQTHSGITQLIDSLLAALPATPTFVSNNYDSFWNWYTVYQDYLANRSSEASWKQIIKEYGCVGPQTVHYNLPAEQQAAVERILLNQGYPSYALFGKDGKLVTKDAPRPSEKERLVQTIEELLRQPSASATQP